MHVSGCPTASSRRCSTWWINQRRAAAAKRRFSSTLVVTTLPRHDCPTARNPCNRRVIRTRSCNFKSTRTRTLMDPVLPGFDSPRPQHTRHQRCRRARDAACSNGAVDSVVSGHDIPCTDRSDNRRKCRTGSSAAQRSTCTELDHNLPRHGPTCEQHANHRRPNCT